MVLALLIAAVPSPQTHSFKVTAVVSYRCYAGTAEQKARDSRTGVVCDSKTYQKTLLDKSVPITIRYEPNPDDDQELVGDWKDEQEFKGRKFSVSITLFKEPKGGFRMRLSASDGEPLTRATEVFVNFSDPKALNAFSLVTDSRGQPEEIDYRVTVGPGGG